MSSIKTGIENHMGLQGYLEGHGRAGRVILALAVLAFFSVTAVAWHEYGHLIASRLLGVEAQILSTALNRVHPAAYDWRIVPIAYAGGLTAALCLLLFDLLVDAEPVEVGLRTAAAIELVYGLAEGAWFLAWYTGTLGGHPWWASYGLIAAAALGGAAGVCALLHQLRRLGWLKPE
jgi:hypothetical protein